MFNEFIVIKDRATCTLFLMSVKASTASRSASKKIAARSGKPAPRFSFLIAARWRHDARPA